METLEAIAKYYYDRSLYVFPNTLKFSWNDWKYKEQTLVDLHGIDWNSAKQVYGVAGKNGIRVLKFMNIKGMNIFHIHSIIEIVLFILHLPQDYPWIILTSESISIVVESSDDVIGMKNRSYTGRKDLGIGMTILLWQADFLLPSFDAKVRFLADFPEKKPQHVNNSNIFKCVDIFRDMNCFDNSEEVMKVLGI